MRRWFELGELDDTTYASSSGNIQFLQLPQKAEFITWANQMVGVNARLTTGSGDPGVCTGSGATHLITPPADVNVLTAYAELRSLMFFGGAPPFAQGLIRQYFDKPGINDGPNDQNVQTTSPGRQKGKAINVSFIAALAQEYTAIIGLANETRIFVLNSELQSLASQVITLITKLTNGKITLAQGELANNLIVDKVHKLLNV